jgi:hypothetical protein
VNPSPKATTAPAVARKPLVRVTRTPSPDLARTAVSRVVGGRTIAATADGLGAEIDWCGARCDECGRTALDVRRDRDGVTRCFSGIGCQGAADRAVKRGAR